MYNVYACFIRPFSVSVICSFTFSPKINQIAFAEVCQICVYTPVFWTQTILIFLVFRTHQIQTNFQYENFVRFAGEQRDICEN